ncbi:MAG: TlpA family protein disulfide reductase [Acidimicrobiales bacterium]
MSTGHRVYLPRTRASIAALVAAGLALIVAAAVLWATTPSRAGSGPGGPTGPTSPGSRLGTVSAGATPPPPAALATGSALTPFSVPAVEAGAPPVALAAYRGRPVVLNFFASWCYPCKAELPMLAAAWRRLGSEVAFVGIDVNDSRANALKLLRADHVGYAVGFDGHGDLATGYGLLDLPATVFVGASGRVVHTRVGQLSPAVLHRWLPRLVAHPSQK